MSLPAKSQAKAPDVKEPPQESSPEETEAKLESGDKQALDVEEEDLRTLEEEKKIPYGRFKEKVDETKTLKDQIERLKHQGEEDRRRAVEDAELRMQMRLQQRSEDEEVDETTREFKKTHSEITSLKRELTELRQEATSQKLNQEIDALKSKYPEADPIAVLGWKKVKGSAADLEELMAHSHNQNIERVERKFKQLIEHKRAKAKSAIPTKESGGLRLKESERPKSMADARALMKKYFGVGSA